MLYLNIVYVYELILNMYFLNNFYFESFADFRAFSLKSKPF